MELPLIISAFIAGILTFLAPCTLPLVPGYLAFISGTNIRDPEKLRRDRRKIFFNGLFFVLGFSSVFIIFGTLAGLLGTAIAPWRLWLTRAGGVVVIILGFWMTGFLKVPFLSSLNAEKRLRIPVAGAAPGPLRSFTLGAAFGFGWTPCVGPILGAVLLLTTAYSTAFEGAALLLIFSLGLAVPFLILAYAVGSAGAFLRKINPLLRWVQPVAGLLIVALGILLISDNFVLLINYGFTIFDFLNYGELQRFL